MPGKQKVACAGLEIEATPAGESGLYFTDEFLEVTFKLRNLTSKRLRGEVTVFYGFGPAGTEGRTHETIEFDLKPNGRDEKKALRRLVGIQGNGIIGMLLPASEEQAVKSENEAEKLLNLPKMSALFHTLYTFTTMEREFYQQFYARPQRIMEQTKQLTDKVRILTIVVIALASVNIALIALQVLGILPPMRVQLTP